MPAYLELTDLEVSDKPRAIGFLLPNQAMVLGNDGENIWYVARCHWHDIYTHIFNVESDEDIGTVDHKPVTESGDPVRLDMDNVSDEIVHGEKSVLNSAVELESGLFVAASELVIRHRILLAPDHGVKISE
ncbi:MAG: hypothetical protein AAB462_02650 [Patescibacteria group bacterium]